MVFPFTLAVILKQKCQCLLMKKLNFFGYNYASINKKGHVPTTHTVVKYFITTPSCNTLYRGGQGVFEQTRKRELQDENYQLCQKTQSDSL